MVQIGELPPPVSGPYRVRVADVLEVSFFRTPELTQSRTVGPDGDITLSPIGRVRAAGMRLDELTRVVRELYLPQFEDPQVTISVEEFSALQVFVGGEVNAGGTYPYRGGLTLTQAIMNAGGFLETARLTEVLVIRPDAEGAPVGTLVNVQDVLRKAQFGNDLALAPSDIVFVPRSRIADMNLFMRQFIRDNLPIPFALGYDVNRR